MKRKVNPNLKILAQSLNVKRGVSLEGSSRSGKTWSSIFFLHLLASRYEEKATVHILKETYNSFKTTLYDDFNRIMPMFGLQSPFEFTKEVASFKLLGLKIHLLGADKESTALGSGCDYFWCNEPVPNISKKVFDQKEMRCRKFFWVDYNPSEDEHWVYESINKRDDVNFLRTTFKDNPNISKGELNKILSYEPTDDNIRQGTADSYMWSVYGLGIAAPREGLVFPYWSEYDELPEDIMLHKFYGVDWGGNDPTTLIEVNISKKHHVVYVKEIVYTPQILNSKLIETIQDINTTNAAVICDSARKDKIYELLMAQINAIGATKGAGSKIDQIEILKEYSIFIHKDSHNAKKEIKNYKWLIDKKTGKSLNQPEDGNDHILDPLGYVARYYNRNYIE